MHVKKVMGVSCDYKLKQIIPRTDETFGLPNQAVNERGRENHKIKDHINWQRKKKREMKIRILE